VEALGTTLVRQMLVSYHCSVTEVPTVTVPYLNPFDSCQSTHWVKGMLYVLYTITLAY